MGLTNKLFENLRDYAEKDESFSRAKISEGFWTPTEFGSFSFNQYISTRLESFNLKSNEK
jgi:hypothetical protein